MPIYRWADYIIDSEIALPELLLCAQDEEASIRICLGDVALPDDVGDRGAAWCNPMEFVLSTAAGRFRVENGKLITIDPAAPRDEDGIRLFLLGSVFAALAVQRDLFVLHGSAVVTEAGVVAFSGDSGEGKSTLAAHLERAGYALYADDTLPLHVAKGEAPLALPSVRRSKLLPDTMEALGLEPGQFPPVMHGQVKRSVLRAGDAALPERQKLCALYILASGEKGSAPAITPIRGVSALQAVRAQTFRPHYALQSGRQTQQIDVCLVIAASIPIFMLKRPWDLSSFDATIAALSQHWQALRFSSPSTLTGTDHAG